MNPFGKFGRIVAMALSLVVLVPISDIAAAQINSATVPSVQKAVPTNSVYPSISGTARVPNTLTAAKGTWGASPTSYTYAWHRCTSATAQATTKPAACTIVTGQSGANYVLSADDVGKFISVSVKAANASGSLTRWSATTTAAVLAQYLPPSNTTAPVVTGTATVSQTLTVSNGAWTESPTSYSRKWYRCTVRQTVVSNAAPAGCSLIADQTASTYTLTASDAAKFVTTSVTATNATGSTTKFAISTAAVAALPIPANTVAPAVTGSAQISRILSVSNGSWNYLATNYTYQWYRCTATKTASDTLPAGCTAISGATSSTYQLLTADSARWISAAVTARNTTGTKTKWTATTVAVTAPAAYAPSISRSPAMTFSADNSSAINGSAMVGSVLLASKGQWLGYPLPEVSYSYWYRCDAPHESSGTERPGDCYAIPGSNGVNGETYLVTADDLGKYLAFETMATNSQGTVRYFTPTTAEVTAIPTLLSAPTLSGTPSYGQTLTLSRGTWSVAPGIAVTYSYSWYRCADSAPLIVVGLPVGCAAVSGETTSTRSLTTSDLGSYIVAVVTVTNSMNQSISAATAVSGQVVSAPVVSVNPTVSGTRVVGETLAVNAGSWIAYPESTPSYQWWRCTSAVSSVASARPGACESISGATSDSYTLAAIDSAKFVTASVEVSNEIGSRVIWAIAVSSVLQAPVNTVAPSLLGNGRYSTVLTISTGAWAGFPTPTYSYSWFRCDSDTPAVVSGVPVGCTTLAGTSGSYTVVEADLGNFLFAVVRGSNSVNSVNALAASTGVSNSVPTLVSAPTVSGPRLVDNVLSVSGGSWIGYPASTKSYQWYRCTSTVSTATSTQPDSCASISGATNFSHTLTADDAGKYVTVATTLTNDLGSKTTWSVVSSITNQSPVNILAPSLSGTGRYNTALAVSAGTWAGYPTPTFTYSWYRCDSDLPALVSGVPSGCTTLASTSTSYTVVAADLGNYVFAVVRGSNSVTAVSATAQALGVVASVPTLVTAPTVSGARLTGSSLTVSSGSWIEYPVSTTSYQWYRCTAAVASATSTQPVSCSAIDGETSSSYTQSVDDAGKYVTVATTKTNDLGSKISWSVVFSMTNQSVSNVTPPTVSGLAKLGETLVGDIGDWTGAPKPIVASQWFVCDGTVSGASLSKPIDCVAQGLAQIATTFSHYCGLNLDGSVLCAGQNKSGQLGVGDFTNSSAPRQVSGISNALSVSVGSDQFSNGTSCAVLATGGVKCWGARATGATNIPVSISGISDAVSISVGYGGTTTCVATRVGQVKCWGINGNYGMLGNGLTANSNTPVIAVGISDAVTVSVGSVSACALTDGGLVSCWGNYSGTGTYSRTPRFVEGIPSVISVSVGHDSTCSTTVDGAVYCWGRNNVGQLGNNTTTNSITPVRVAGISNAVSVSVGFLHACALLADQTVKCWGYSSVGQLGDGVFDTAGSGTVFRTTALAVPGVSIAASMSAGGTSSCVVSVDNSLSCWGRSDWLQDSAFRNGPGSVIPGFDTHLSDTSLRGKTIAFAVLAQNRTNSVSVWSATTAPISQ